MIPAGQRDQPITLETATVTTNSLGQERQTWAEHSQHFAKLMETRGREFLSGDYQAEERAVFGILWTEIDSKARVRWGGRVWDVESVTGTYQQNETWLHCRSVGEAN